MMNTLTLGLYSSLGLDKTIPQIDGGTVLFILICFLYIMNQLKQLSAEMARVRSDLNNLKKDVGSSK